MERGRWLPQLDERPTVFVNVPLFRLWASDPVRGEEPLRMNVVVGKSLSHNTPLFVQEMEYVIFRPYWNPPPASSTKEILPRARRDPSYLERRELRDRGERRRRRQRAPRDPREPRCGRRRTAVPAPEAGPQELARARQVHLPQPATTSTCTERRRPSSSRGPGATSATAASASRIRRGSPNGFCGTSRAGRGRGSTRRCRRSARRR